MTATSARAPSGILDSGDYVGVEVTRHHPQQPGWARPSTFFFRRTSAGWTLVGVERSAVRREPTAGQPTAER